MISYCINVDATNSWSQTRSTQVDSPPTSTMHAPPPAGDSYPYILIIHACYC